MFEIEDGIYIYNPEHQEELQKKYKLKVKVGNRPVEENEEVYREERIFDFDWEKDLLQTPAPNAFVPWYSFENSEKQVDTGAGDQIKSTEEKPSEEKSTEEKPPNEDALWEYMKIGMGNWLPDYKAVVQADPMDILEFSEPVQGFKKHCAHKLIWRNTLDRYLEHYYWLTRKKERRQGKAFVVPKVMERKLAAYFDTHKSRKKPMPSIVSDTVDMREEVLDVRKTGEELVISAFGKAHLNHACRWLFTKDGAPLQPYSLFYDGLLVRVEDKEETQTETVTLVPDFSLCDYMDHEMLTGISLSIEITAVLLEFPDPWLREKALDAFENGALPTVVKSRELFTRISAARNFFQQILMEQSVGYYNWHASSHTSRIPDKKWNEMVERAAWHVDLLKKTMVMRDTPANETDRAIEHLEALLSKVDKPVNLPEYVKRPKHGLAAFCNPAHHKINWFLKELKKKDAMQITKIPRCRRDEHDLFRDVHARVKRAIEQALEEAVKRREEKTE